MKRSEITPQMIEDGTVFVEVYPMKHDGEDSRLVEGNEQADFFDVALRPAAILTPDGRTDPIEEWDDLTIEQAGKIVESLELEYPDICTDWIDP